MKVNKNFAIKLVAEEPVSHVETRVVSCDGGGGALGHPKVYINLVRLRTRSLKTSRVLLLLGVDGCVLWSSNHSKDLTCRE